MPHIRKIAQHDLRRGLGRGNDPPGAPFAAVAAREPHVGRSDRALTKASYVREGTGPVDMDDQRASGGGPVARHLLGPVEGRVHQHHDAHPVLPLILRHAQFPFDISPRISSWRQFIYFSDHLHQRSGLRSSFSA